MAGGSPLLSVVQARLVDAVPLDPRPEYQRGILCWGRGIPTVVATGVQRSSRLLSMRGATCLIELPAQTAEQPSLPAGTTINVILLPSQ